jgi:hypothetical protein
MWKAGKPALALRCEALNFGDPIAVLVQFCAPELVPHGEGMPSIIPVLETVMEIVVGGPADEAEVITAVCSDDERGNGRSE